MSDNFSFTTARTNVSKTNKMKKDCDASLSADDRGNDNNIEENEEMLIKSSNASY